MLRLQTLAEPLNTHSVTIVKRITVQYTTHLAAHCTIAYTQITALVLRLDIAEPHVS